jgi:transcription elongation factor Elf1
MSQSSSSEAPWRKPARIYDRPRTFPKHPICPRCDVPMWLSKVRTKLKKTEYFYECKVCEDKMSIAND